MPSDSEFKHYHEYLLKRTWRSIVYRRIFLYPRFNKFLHGLVLDVGCGIGDFLKFFPNAVGLDVNPYNVKYCQSLGLNCTVLDSARYPFDNAFFDAIVLDNVLEHLEQPNSLLSEVHRILSPAGHFVIGVPGIKGFASDADHKIFYDENSLSALLNQSGFQLHQSFYTPFRSEFLSQKMSQYCLYGVFKKHQ